MQKGISIILPTLNRADYLASTVDCLIEQDFGEPYEIIIVDQSAAIDSTMYSRAKDSDTLIKYYHVTEFRGLPEARNFGVQHTQYAYILFLDDDIECGLIFPCFRAPGASSGVCPPAFPAGKQKTPAKAAALRPPAAPFPPPDGG